MELKIYHSPGKIVYREANNRTIEYLDQLDPEIHYYRSAVFPWHIKRTYKITGSEYYNLITYGDPYKLHYCAHPECNNVVTDFKGYMYGFGKYCSKKCKDNHLSILYEEHPEWKEHLRDPNSYFRRRSVETIKSMFANGTHPFTTVEVHARSRMNNFSNDGIAWFYWARLHDYSHFKIGIAHYPYELNSKKSNYRYIYPIIEGDSQKIAKIEYQVKVHFNTRSEYFEIGMFKEVITYALSLR